MKTPLRSLKTALTGLLSAFAIAAYADNASSFQPVTTADRTTTNVTDIVWSASSGDAAELYDTVASTVEFDTGDAALSYSPAANDAGTDPASTTVNLQFSAAATAPAVPTGAQTAITVYIVNGVTNYYVYAKGAYGASGAPTAEAGWVEVPTLVPDTTQAVSVQISIDYDQGLARYVIGGVNAGDYYLANTPDGTTVAKKINSLNFAGSGVLSSTITTKAKAAYAILDEGTSPATTTYYDTLAAAEAGYASATTPTLKRVAASSPYAETPVTFTVNFVDENGTTVLNTQTLAYGAPVAYAGQNSPSKADSGSNTYTWTGWNDGTTDYGTSDSLPIATADATYTATYKTWTMITPPSAAQNLVYNGATQDGIEDNAAYTRGDAYSAKNVGTYTASVALADKANTVWSDTKTTVDKTYTWSIAAKTLGLSWSNTTLTYNGSSQAPTATLTGVEGSDDVTVAVSGDRTDVGTYNATADSLGGADAGNYALPALKTQQFSIAKKALAVTANAKTITYGDAPANDGVTYSGFVAGEDENNLSGTLAYAYDYTQYGNVGNYTITPSGLTSSNYDITFNAGTLQVNPKEVGLTWDNNTFTYDGNAHPAATATGLVNGDQINVTVSGTETDVGNNYTATATGLTGTQAANYTLPAANTQAFEITGATLATFAVTLADWTYGGTAATPVVTGNDGNGTVSFTYSDDGVNFSSTVPTAAGSYTVKAEVPAAGNYAAGTATDTFAILPATITVTAEATTQVYGDQPSRIAYTVSGLVNGEPEGNAGLSGALSFDQSAGAGAAGRTYPDVDAYPITAGDLVIGSGGNYTLGSIVTAGVSYTVTPAALEVKAEDASVPHGTAPANLTFASPAYTVTGLVNGDTEASVFGANAISVSSPSYVQTASLSDTFPIIPAYTYNGYNYTVTAQNGTLSISSVTFPIEFVNWDNSHIDTVQVEYGDIPSTGASPTRPNDQANSYQFVGWENAGQQYPVGTALPAATAAATYTAYYDGTAVPYTVTFVDFNGTNIVQQTIGYGGYPTAPTGLTRASDNVYSYTFAGWLDSNNNSVTPNTVAVTGNVTYTADYTSTFVEYRITFLDGDPATGNGTILWYNDYHYNDVPAFGGTPSTPIRVSTSLSWYWRFNDRWLWEYDNQYYPANSLLPVTSQGKYYADFRKVWIKGIVPTVLTNTTTIANYRTVTGNSAAVTYRLADTDAFTSEPTVTSTPAGAANGTLTIADLAWNAKQDWTITTSVTEDEQTLTETLAGSLYAKDKTAWFSEETLGTVTGFGDDITEGVAPAAASAAGQQVRINTRLDISDSGMDTVPAVGNARGGFAVLQLTGDTAPAYYAYTGDSTLGTEGWVKLSGAAPVAGEHDVLITVDTATDEAYYYVDGASLYIDGATKTYAIPVASGTTVSAIGFANPDGVKSAVVGEYDVPYVAAIGTTGYTTAAAAISAVAKDGTETLELLANVDPAATINLASGQSVKVKAGSFTGLTVSTEVSGKEVRTSDPVDGVVTYDLVDSTATVIWVVEGRDNVEVDYQIGATPVYPQDAAAPEKASTDQYSYTFAGWAATAGGEVLAPLPDVAAGGATYYAVFNQAVRSYTITWKNDDGTTIDTTTVEYGQTPTHADASKVADETYTYEFAGWDPSVANVSGPATYTATFTPTYIDYTITWTDHSGTVKTETLHYDATPTAPAADPAQYVENGLIYTGTWPTPATVTADATYAAVYDAGTPAVATVITIADAGATTNTVGSYASLAEAVAAAQDGSTVVLLDNVTLDARVEPNLGENTTLTIDLNGKTITRTGTSGNGSAFDVKSGDVTIQNGTIDCTQDDTAIAEDGVYAITSCSGSNVTLADLAITVNSECGACAYPFAGSTMTIESGTYANTTTTPYRYNTAITGMAVNQPNNATQNLIIKGGSFSQYDPQLGDDSGFMTDFTDEGFVAIDDGNGNWVVQPGYNVTFADEDGNVLETQRVPAGETPVYGGAAPAKASTDSAVYAFAGWSPAIVAAAADTTYTAQFSSIYLDPATLELYPNCSNYVHVIGAPEGSTYTYKAAGKVSIPSYASTPPGWSKTEGWAWPYGGQPGGTGTITVTVSNNNAQVAQLVANVTVKDVAAVVDGEEYASADFANALAAAKSGDKVLEMYYYMSSYGKVALDEDESIRWKPADNRGKASLWTSAATIPATTDTAWYKAVASKDDETGITTITCVNQGVPYVKIDDGTTVTYSTESFTSMNKAGATYTLLRDMTDQTGGVVSKTGVILDLNGKKLGLATGIKVNAVNTAASLTIRDTSAAGTGEISGGNNDSPLVWVLGGDTVTIESGTFVSDGSTAVYTSDGGTATISGGTFSATTASGLLNCNDSNKGTITVTGGSFQGFDPANNAADGAGTDYVATGYVSVADDPSSGWYTVYEAVTVSFVNAKGVAPADQVIGKGKTATAPADPEAEGFTFDGWFADGASVAFDFTTPVTADLTLTAQYSSAVATVITIAENEGTVTTNTVGSYASLAAAVAAAPAGSTVVLLTDVNEEVVNSNANSFTIDLNGNTWSSDSDVLATTAGTITIEATNGGTMTTEAAQCCAVWGKGGDVVINGGTFVSKDNKEATIYVSDANSEITINGGTFENTDTRPYQWNNSLQALTLNVKNDLTGQHLIINGGTFIGNDPQRGDDTAGGSFAQSDVPFVSDGFVAIDDGNGNWVVQPGFNVTFDADGGTPAPEAQRVAAGGTATEPTGVTLANHSLRAWKLGNDDYDFDTVLSADITLVADWTLDQHTVIWVVDGVESTNKVDYGTALSTIQPVDPTKAGDANALYTFTGWSPAIAEGDTVTADATYTAGFKTWTKVAVPTAASGLVYTGSEQTGVAAGTGYTLTGDKATNAGDYTATATLADAENTVWADDTTAPTANANKSINWSIAKATATAPTAVANLVYDGTEQTGVAVGTGYTLTGNTATDAGDYTATATLAANYEWDADPATGTKTIDWSIAPKAVTVTADNASKNIGESDPASFSATVEGTIGSDTVSYTVARAAGETAGTYAITPTGDADQGNYSVTYVPGTFTINMAYFTVTWIADGSEYAKNENVPYGTTTATLKPATDPTKTSSATTDYEFKDWGTLAETVTADATYTATWTESARKYALTINYVGPTGFPAQESYSAQVANGAEYSVASPVVEGYTPDTATVTGTMGTEPVNVTVTYTANAATVISIALDAPTLDATGVSGKNVTVAADFGSTEISGAVDVTATPNGTVGDATAGVATATFPAEWNQGVEWTIADATANSTVAPLTGKTYLKAETAWDMTSASAEGQAVRIQTSIEFDPVGVTQGPTVTADDRGGITVVNGKYAAFNGSTWVELAGATPKAEAVDLLMVADMAAASPTVRYYIDGVALYALDNETKVYAIPLKAGDAYLTGVAATDTDAEVTFTAEYDVPYVAAIGTTGYTNATTAVAAADKTGTDVLELLANVAGEIALTDGQSVKVKLNGFTGPTFTTSETGKQVVDTLDAETGVTTYALDAQTFLIQFVNYDNTVLQSDMLAYGATPAYTNAATPVKPEDAQYTYTFSGWAPAFATVTETATYTAQFSATPKATGAVSGGVTILDSKPLAFTSIVVDGSTVTVTFEAGIVVAENAETADLPFAVVYKTALDGEKITSANNAALVTLDAAAEGKYSTGTAVITLPSGVTNSFFLFGFDNGPAENAGN